MNDFLPIILSIVAALVVVGGLVPVLMKARKSGANYPERGMPMTPLSHRPQAAEPLWRTDQMP